MKRSIRKRQENAVGNKYMDLLKVCMKAHQQDRICITCAATHGCHMMDIWPYTIGCHHTRDNTCTQRVDITIGHHTKPFAKAIYVCVCEQQLMATTAICSLLQDAYMILQWHRARAAVLCHIITSVLVADSPHQYKVGLLHKPMC